MTRCAVRTELELRRKLAKAQAEISARDAAIKELLVEREVLITECDSWRASAEQLCSERNEWRARAQEQGAA